METIGAFLVGIIAIVVLVKLLSLPFKIIWNSIVGCVMLWFVNLFGAGIDITFFKALIAGVFGIPGVIVILLAHFL